jgi:hypothetical protein
MVMQQALRPHAIAGVALALGASLIALTPVTAPSPAVPHVYAPEVQLVVGPTIVFPDPLSGVENVLNSDFATLESDVTHGFSTLETDLTSDLSGLGSLSGLDSDLVNGLSALESDVTSGFSTLNGDLTSLLDGNGVSIDNWLLAINEKLSAGSDLLNSLQGIDTLLGNGDNLLSNGVGQLVNIDEILFVMCGVACADFTP